MITVKNIIIQFMEQNNFDGLVSDSVDGGRCSCCITDNEFIPCEQPNTTCQVVKSKNLNIH